MIPIFFSNRCRDGECVQEETVLGTACKRRHADFDSAQVATKLHYFTILSEQLCTCKNLSLLEKVIIKWAHFNLNLI